MNAFEIVNYYLDIFGIEAIEYRHETYNIVDNDDIIEYWGSEFIDKNPRTIGLKYNKDTKKGIITIEEKHFSKDKICINKDKYTFFDDGDLIEGVSIKNKTILQYKNKKLIKKQPIDEQNYFCINKNKKVLIK